MSIQERLFRPCAEGRHESCMVEFKDNGVGWGLRCTCDCHREKGSRRQ